MARDSCYDLGCNYCPDCDELTLNEKIKTPQEQEFKFWADYRKLKSVTSDMAELIRNAIENGNIQNQTMLNWSHRVLKNYEKIKWKGSQKGRSKFLTGG